MPHDITCVKCSTPRKNAQYKNTTHCNHCRLLENLRFVRDRIYDCHVDGCQTRFAPIARGDLYCSTHDFGSGVFDRCALCKEDDQELVRGNVPVCKACAREPGGTRRKFLAGLIKGQRDRRAAHNHVPKES